MNQAKVLSPHSLNQRPGHAEEPSKELVLYKSLKPFIHPCNVYACVCARVQKATVPQGQEDGLARDHEEQVNMMSERRQGKADRRVKETRRSLWIQWNSSPPPRLLWEASGACGESEVRRGLSGTKLQIHMICLAKRVKEKWIKAWRDQRNATIKSRRLPWDQQEMHIIYKLFFGSVRCGGNWLLLFGGCAAGGGG